MPTEGLGEGQAGPSELTIAAQLWDCIRMAGKWDAFEEAMVKNGFAAIVSAALRASGAALAEALADVESKQVGLNLYEERLQKSEAALATMTKERDKARALVELSVSDALKRIEIVTRWAHVKELEASRAAATKAEALADVLASTLDAIKEATFDGDKTVCAIATRGLAVYTANRRVAIRAPQPPEPVCNLIGGDRGHEDCDHAPSSPPPPSAHRHTWGMTMCLSCSAPKPDPDAPPPSEWREPTKGSMTVGDLPYVLCPTCQKRLPRAGWGHTCKAPPPSEEPSYPCWRCGKARTKAEGGTTFTFCDDCWPVPSPSPTREESRRPREPKHPLPRAVPCGGIGTAWECVARHHHGSEEAARRCDYIVEGHEPEGCIASEER